MLDNFYIYSDFSMRCIRRTTIDYRGCRSSLAGCRFGRSGSSGFVVGFLRLRWCGFDRRAACVPHVPYVRTEGFVRATACYNLLTEYFMLEEEIPSSNYYSQLILWIYQKKPKLNHHLYLLHKTRSQIYFQRIQVDNR